MSTYCFPLIVRIWESDRIQQTCSQLIYKLKIRFQNHAGLFTFYHLQYIFLLIYNVQRFKWIIIFKIIFGNTLKNNFQNFNFPQVEETISIFNSSQLLLNQRVQRDIKHKASQNVTENIFFCLAQNRN